MAEKSNTKGRRYISLLDYPREVQTVLRDYKEIWTEMVREDVRKVCVEEIGYPGVEGLAWLRAKTYQFPPEDLVIAFIERVRPKLLDELAERGLFTRG